MSAHTNIHWCDSTVNPAMGCDGCELWQRSEGVPTDETCALTGAAPRRSCYAGRLHETRGKGSKGFAPTFLQPTQFPGRMKEAAGWSDLTGTVRPDKPWLDGLPRMIFVSDMGDALSRSIPFDFLEREIIEAVTSRKGERHIWLWLTKRPSRMAEFCRWLADQHGVAWPANLWVGTTLTSQTTTNRARHLLSVGDDTTTRLLSLEPQVGPIDLGDGLPQYHWIIQGGESGSDARPFDAAWARDLRDRCRAASTPYFLKQLGAQAVSDGRQLRLRQSHGGDWAEWPDDLRVRQVPRSRVGREPSINDLLEALPDSDDAGANDNAPSAAADPPAGTSDPPSATPDTHSQPNAEPPAGEAVPTPGVQRNLSQQLEAILARLAGELSELAMVKLLPEAKRIYEELHPQARHGGSRRQDAESATCPAFVTMVANRTGIAKRTVYSRLETAEKLATLDPEAEKAAYGTAAANQLRFLVRVAAVPRGAPQLDLIKLFDRNRVEAKVELEKWEQSVGLRPMPAEEQDEDEAEAGEDDQDEATDDDEAEGVEPAEDAEDVGPTASDTAVTAILVALGVTTVEECLPAIETLKTLQPRIHALEADLAASQAKVRGLDRELKLYRGGHLAELFRVLGARTAKDALQTARSMTGADHAAP